MLSDLSFLISQTCTPREASIRHWYIPVSTKERRLTLHKWMQRINITNVKRGFTPSIIKLPHCISGCSNRKINHYYSQLLH